MHSNHRQRREPPQRQVDVTSTGIYQSLRQLRIKDDGETPIECVLQKERKAVTSYGRVPNDLDRIAQAKSEMELLDLINEVLQLMRRSGMMADLPQPLRTEWITTSPELRIAMRRMQGTQSFIENVDGNSDAMLVLRAVLSVADETLVQLRRRK